jgi:dihydropteroate synthase
VARQLSLPQAGASRTLVMGILNVTPDSFSDGGRLGGVDQLIDAAAIMVADGADLLDVGGESTRPGAAPVSDTEELARVLPAIEVLSRRFDVPVSVDTRKPVVMRAAVAAGAAMINDVYALRAPGALETAAELAVPVVLMHMQGDPVTMQQGPSYDDPLAEVTAFLRERIAMCESAGIARQRLVVDPGFGFGKKLPHNLALLRDLRTLVGALGLPLLAGVSRKSMIGELTGRPVGERLSGSVALAVYAALNGASILRVHDVRPTVDALRVIRPLLGDGGNG